MFIYNAITTQVTDISTMYNMSQFIHPIDNREIIYIGDNFQEKDLFDLKAPVFTFNGNMVQ